MICAHTAPSDVSVGNVRVGDVCWGGGERRIFEVSQAVAWHTLARLPLGTDSDGVESRVQTTVDEVLCGRSVRASV